MFEVLVFVYENYWRGDACPESTLLQRKLSAHGFDAGEIHDALIWLEGLNFAAQSAGAGQGEDQPEHPEALLPSAGSMRVYSITEQDKLGSQCLGFISFLESAGVLPAAMREIVIERAMATPEAAVPIDDLKIIVLMVYWSFGHEPDTLVLDELCEPAQGRLAH